MILPFHCTPCERRENTAVGSTEHPAQKAAFFGPKPHAYCQKKGARSPKKPPQKQAGARQEEMKGECREGFIKMAHLLLQNGHVHDGIE